MRFTDEEWSRLASEEVSGMFGLNRETGLHTRVEISPEGSPCANPAFDVTPARLVTGIITEKGLFKPGEISKAVTS